MENMNVVLEKIKFVEQGFIRYYSDLNFESGINYDDNGTPIEYDVIELTREVKSIMKILESEVVGCLNNTLYGKARNNIALLERLNSLLKVL